MDILFKIFENTSINTLQDSLHLFERQFTYPLQGSQDSFYISHGKEYHSFFALQGRTIFVVALQDNQVIGLLSFIIKNEFPHSKNKLSLYFCDLKVSKDFQGFGITRKIYNEAFSFLCKQGIIFKLPFTYFITMQNSKGDFAKNARHKSWLSIFQEYADLNIYFANVSTIKNMSIPQKKSHESILPAIILSHTKQEPVINMSGLKDIILCSNGTSLPLQHANNVVLFGRDYLQHLKETASKLKEEDILCFAIDSRQSNIINVLEQHDVKASGLAKVYCPFWQKIQYRDRLVYVGTHEI